MKWNFIGTEPVDFLEKSSDGRFLNRSGHGQGYGTRSGDGNGDGVYFNIGNGSGNGDGDGDQLLFKECSGFGPYHGFDNGDGGSSR